MTKTTLSLATPRRAACWMKVALVCLVGCLVGSASGETRQRSAPGAGASPVIVELFTSQGCSSCPSADRLLRLLSRQPGVIPLAFHVDYWNRLGWHDPFSSAEWSGRQRRYARVLQRGSVYTPQAVVDGRLHLVGSDKSGLRDEIRRRRDQEPVAEVGLSFVEAEGHDQLRLEVRTTLLRQIGKADLRVPVALFENGLVTSVRRGENARRTLENDFVVRHLDEGVSVVGRPGHQERFTIDLPLDPDWDRSQLGVVAFLQHPASMRIYGGTMHYLRDASRAVGAAAGLNPHRQ